MHVQATHQQQLTLLSPVLVQALQLCDADDGYSGGASSIKRRRVEALLPAPGQVLR
jgi:hypothetical protein